MTDDQLAKLWAFARGDHEPLRFELWFLAQDGLEEPLGNTLHWDLTSADYRIFQEVLRLRATLMEFLKLHENLACECRTLRDLAVVPMGMNGLDERIFETVMLVKRHESDRWWLYLSKCSVCEQHWMIAQDERIYDDYFLRRLTKDQALRILSDADWPTEFQTYEQVLTIARKLSTPPTWGDLRDSPVAYTIQEMQKKNPALTLKDAAYIIGVSIDDVNALLAAKG